MWGKGGIFTMIEFIDRIQANPNRIQLTAVEGAENTYDFSRVGEVTEAGTDINRSALMAIQGFQPRTTVISADGNTITETNAQGHTLVTVFSNNGKTITETFTGDKTIVKTTTFSDDGKTITEVIS